MEFTVAPVVNINFRVISFWFIFRVSISIENLPSIRDVQCSRKKVTHIFFPLLDVYIPEWFHINTFIYTYLWVMK